MLALLAFRLASLVLSASLRSALRSPCRGIGEIGFGAVAFCHLTVIRLLAENTYHSATRDTQHSRSEYLPFCVV